MVQLIVAKNFERYSIEQGLAAIGTRSHLVASANYSTNAIKIGSKPTRLFFNFYGNGGMRVEARIVASFTAMGTQVPTFNLNRESTLTPCFELYYNPGGSVQPYVRLIPSDGSDTLKGLYFKEYEAFHCGGWLLSAGTFVYFAMLNKDTVSRYLNYIVYGVAIE